MTGLSLVAALAAGVLALLSPCSALLLPSFFAYAFASRTALVARTTVFALGLAAVLVPLGSGIQAIGSLFTTHRQLLVTGAGWVVVALGVLLALGGGFALPHAARLQGASAGLGARTRRAGWVGWVATFALGGVYGLAGFCSGPALGAILTIAATGRSPLAGAALLLAYAVGMALPLFLLALLWERLGLSSRSWVRGRMLSLGPLRVHSTSLLGGLLFVAIGAAMLALDGTAGLGTVGIDLTDAEFAAQRWVLDHLGGVPWWWLAGIVSVGAAVVAWGRRD